MILDYATKEGILRKYVGRAMLVVIIALTCWTVIRCLPWARRKLQILSLQKRLAEHVEPPAQLAYVNELPTYPTVPNAIARARIPASTFGPDFQMGDAGGPVPDYAAKVLPDWTRLRGLLSIQQPEVVATVFAHERVASNGKGMLVIVDVQRNDFTIKFQIYAISRETPFRAARVTPSESIASLQKSDLRLLTHTADPLQILSGQVDPSNAARFYIPFVARFSEPFTLPRPISSTRPFSSLVLKSEKLACQIVGTLSPDGIVTLRLEETPGLKRILAEIEAHDQAFQDWEATKATSQKSD